MQFEESSTLIEYNYPLATQVQVISSECETQGCLIAKNIDSISVDTKAALADTSVSFIPGATPSLNLPDLLHRDSCITPESRDVLKAESIDEPVSQSNVQMSEETLHFTPETFPYLEDSVAVIGYSFSALLPCAKPSETVSEFLVQDSATTENALGNGAASAVIEKTVADVLPEFENFAESLEEAKPVNSESNYSWHPSIGDNEYLEDCVSVQFYSSRPVQACKTNENEFRDARQNTVVASPLLSEEPVTLNIEVDYNIISEEVPAAHKDQTNECPSPTDSSLQSTRLYADEHDPSTIKSPVNLDVGNVLDNSVVTEEVPTTVASQSLATENPAASSVSTIGEPFNLEVSDIEISGVVLENPNVIEDVSESANASDPQPLCLDQGEGVIVVDFPSATLDNQVLDKAVETVETNSPLLAPILAPKTWELSSICGNPVPCCPLPPISEDSTEDNEKPLAKFTCEESKISDFSCGLPMTDPDVYSEALDVATAKQVDIQLPAREDAGVPIERSDVAKPSEEDNIELRNALDCVAPAAGNYVEIVDENHGVISKANEAIDSPRAKGADLSWLQWIKGRVMACSVM